MDPLSSSTGQTTSPETLLIPWDPESTEHVERLHHQRLACGWSSDMPVIEEWRVMQREGKKAFHWIVLSANDPLQHEKLSRHTSQNPMQANPISDTATLLHGATRTPSPSYSFHPVGHVSLDSSNADSPNADPTLAEAPEHIYHITSLYISQALQGTGLGRAAMDAVEAQAVRYPLFAKVLTLDTLARELYFELSDRYEAYGWEKPKIINQDWYARRGYEIYKRVPDYIQQKDGGGKVWPLAATFMRKDLVSTK